MPDYIRNRSHNAPEENEGFFCRFTFGQFFALLVLEVFTLFFVFYLGARYGPEFLGFKKKGPVIVGEEKQESPRVMTTDDPQVKAMAKDIVEKANTPELKERLAQMLNRPAHQNETQGADVAKVDSEFADAPVQEQPAPSLPPAEDVQNPAKQPSQLPMRQASPPAEVEKGAVRIKSAENAKYAIQVGSYQQMSEANSVLEKWKSKGYPAYLMIADIPDRGRWYRVRMGGFATRDEAKKYQREIESREAIQAIVVMNEQ